MFISIKRFIGNKLQSLCPSSFFRYRRMICRFMGIKIHSSSKVNIGFKVYGSGKIEIGSNTWIGPNCHIYTAEDKGVFIGNNCDIAPEVTFICGSHEIGWGGDRMAGKGIAHSIIVENGTWICTRSTILCNKISSTSIIGACSVVLNDVPPGVLFAGSPAVEKKRYQE